jgi:hypothetical protein
VFEFENKTRPTCRPRRKKQVEVRENGRAVGGKGWE